MALSNIFREPRREITESVVGIVAVGTTIALAFYIDNLFARWFASQMRHPDSGDWYFGMFIGFIGMIAALFIGSGLLVITHEIGDSLCDALEAWGIQMRPRNRAR